MVFQKMLELFSSRDKWTQGAYAKTSDGTYTLPSLGDAACWCLSGALWECGSEPDSFDLLAAAIQNKFPDRIQPDNIPKNDPMQNPIIITRFNDNTATTFDDVIDVITEAIKEKEIV